MQPYPYGQPRGRRPSGERRRGDARRPFRSPPISFLPAPHRFAPRPLEGVRRHLPDFGAAQIWDKGSPCALSHDYHKRQWLRRAAPRQPPALRGPPRPSPEPSPARAAPPRTPTCHHPPPGTASPAPRPAPGCGQSRAARQPGGWRRVTARGPRPRPSPPRPQPLFPSRPPRTEGRRPRPRRPHTVGARSPEPRLQPSGSAEPHAALPARTRTHAHAHTHTHTPYKGPPRSPSRLPSSQRKETSDH